VTILPESIEVGKCYLARGYLAAGGKSLRVRRVTQIHPGGRVQFEQRRRSVPTGRPWPTGGTMQLDTFALAVEREVPCDWILLADEATP
jgi:hypothetical protein